MVVAVDDLLVVIMVLMMMDGDDLDIPGNTTAGSRERPRHHQLYCCCYCCYCSGCGTV